MSIQNPAQQVAARLKLPVKGVSQTLALLASGATIPFISRYRKEATGELTEVEIEAISNQHEALLALNKRKESILQSLAKQEILTEELRAKIAQCDESTVLEDLYLPYRPKRGTRASAAREKGLEALAQKIKAQLPGDPLVWSAPFAQQAGMTPEEALQGACDILAEFYSESETARKIVRFLYQREAIIESKVCKGKEAEGEKYASYFDVSEPLKRCSSHRFLAIQRGEREGILKRSISLKNPQEAVHQLENRFVQNQTPSASLVKKALSDGYKRLLKPSIEGEILSSARQAADSGAIDVFAENVKQLLLASPLGEKAILSIDPGYRTGCKVVCLSPQGDLLHHAVIYPHPPHEKKRESEAQLLQWIHQYAIEAIAVGNGTAGRETLQWVSALPFPHPVSCYSVNENGASIYSASAVAREEFPQHDVTVRGAVSIGRRLADPLAELVKIEPKSIGVGQYQHDVDQTALKKRLDAVVLHCVNYVGVDLNTASKHLLAYVSGLGPTLAANIVAYRRENGAFQERKELLNVPRMGAKAFEQCAGFLRITDGKNPLDNSAVHPESYSIVYAMAKEVGCKPEELIGAKQRLAAIDPKRYLSESVGLPTLRDILSELEKPRRDPRGPLSQTNFDSCIQQISDLYPDLELNGVVTNITRFGCFVDIGLKEQGLVHISQMADRFVSDPTQIVSLNQSVRVRVLSVDLSLKRIQLTLKSKS